MLHTGWIDLWAETIIFLTNLHQITNKWKTSPIYVNITETSTMNGGQTTVENKQPKFQNINISTSFCF